MACLAFRERSAQHTARRLRPSRCLFWRPGDGLDPINAGQAHDEASASPLAFAARLYGSSMQLDETARERETNPQAVLDAITPIGGLRKELEHAGEHILGNADACIRHAHHHMFVHAFRLDVEDYLRAKVTALANAAGIVVPGITDVEEGDASGASEAAGDETQGDHWPAGRE